MAHAYTCICMHSHTCTCKSTHVQIHSQANIMLVHAHTCTDTHTHKTHMYSHLHTCTFTLTYIWDTRMLCLLQNVYRIIEIVINSCMKECLILSDNSVAKVRIKHNSN